MLYGPNMTNFAEICLDLERQGLAICCQDAQRAKQQVVHCLSNPARLQQQSGDLRSWIVTKSGALRKL